MITPNEKGTRPVIFTVPNFGQAGPLNWAPVDLPCGTCVGCKLKKSQEWALRCVHEAQMHNANCFITLTYNDENLPSDGSLKHRDFQLFMKRLRKKCGSVRFYQCGEYGEKLGRPHYHALLFGHQFDDMKFWKQTKSGEKIYRSPILEKLWTNPKTRRSMGWSSVGSMTYHSAAYVARYTMAKKNGAQAEAHYSRLDTVTGEFHTPLKPEYNTMSRNPGIGSSWFEKYGLTDVYPGDSVTLQNRKMSPPRFYDNKLKNINKDLYDRLKVLRVERAKKHFENNTPARLRVRARIQELKAIRLKREIE